MKVVILAGGYGTRISEESHLRPKPMIEIGERPILWHIMRYYSHYGFNDFVICCGYKGWMIKEYFVNYYLHNSDLTVDFTKGGEMQIHSNKAEAWKVTMVDTGLNTMTGGRVKRIADYVENKPFMLTYGDGVSDVDLNALLAQHKQSEAIVTMTAVQPSGRFGVLEMKGNFVSAFREKDKEDGNWINGGFMVAEPELFNYIENDSTVLEQAPLNNLSSEGKLKAYKHDGFWACMDTQRDKFALEEAWKSKAAKWKVW